VIPIRRVPPNGRLGICQSAGQNLSTACEFPLGSQRNILEIGARRAGPFFLSLNNPEKVDPLSNPGRQAGSHRRSKIRLPDHHSGRLGECGFRAHPYLSFPLRKHPSRIGESVICRTPGRGTTRSTPLSIHEFNHYTAVYICFFLLARPSVYYEMRGAPGITIVRLIGSMAATRNNRVELES